METDNGLMFGEPKDVRIGNMGKIAESSLVETYNRGFQVGVVYLIKHRNQGA